MSKHIDKTALSYWFPIIKEAGLPVPRTIIIDMPVAAQKSIWAAFDGVEPDGPDLDVFADHIAAAGDSLGWPCFLRTDHTSGKHNWAHTCHLPNREAIKANVYGVAEYSELAGFMGLPWGRWAVRELLPTKPMGVCRRYGNMPICKEFRFFAEDGEIQCWHPYWPEGALADGDAEYTPGFDLDGFYLPDNLDELSDIARRATRALGGAWSVDLLETERGWFLTDMAEAHKSFHWEGCAVAEKGSQ